MSYTQEIKDKIIDLMNQYPNTTMIRYGYKTTNGIKTKTPSIVFGVKVKKSLSELSSDEILPKSISLSSKDIITDVIEEPEAEPMAVEYCPNSFYTWQTTPPPQRNTQRPLMGGLEVKNQTTQYLGTMGFIAVDNETNSLVGVTNAHVALAGNTKSAFIASENNRGLVNCFNDDMAQDASSSTSLRIGKVKKYKPLYSTQSNYTDGALLTLKESEINLNESFKFYGFESDITGPLDFATTEEIDSLVDNNYELYSVGRTTGAKGFGVTKLLFDGYSSFNISYNLGNGSSKSVFFTDCISYVASADTTTTGNICYSPIEGGDSGSALLANIDGTIKIIGLSFAGSGYIGQLKFLAHACRIDKVSEDLNISPFVGQSVNFSDNDNPLVHYIAGTSSSETVEINGKTYYQQGLINI
jgi:hypothetical protein